MFAHSRTPRDPSIYPTKLGWVINLLQFALFYLSICTRDYGFTRKILLCRRLSLTRVSWAACCKNSTTSVSDGRGVKLYLRWRAPVVWKTSGRSGRPRRGQQVYRRRDAVRAADTTGASGEKVWPRSYGGPVSHPGQTAQHKRIFSAGDRRRATGNVARAILRVRPCRNEQSGVEPARGKTCGRSVSQAGHLPGSRPRFALI